MNKINYLQFDESYIDPQKRSSNKLNSRVESLYKPSSNLNLISDEEYKNIIFNKTSNFIIKFVKFETKDRKLLSNASISKINKYSKSILENENIVINFEKPRSIGYISNLKLILKNRRTTNNNILNILSNNINSPVIKNNNENENNNKKNNKRTANSGTSNLNYINYNNNNEVKVISKTSNSDVSNNKTGYNNNELINQSEECLDLNNDNNKLKKVIKNEHLVRPNQKITCLNRPLRIIFQMLGVVLTENENCLYFTKKLKENDFKIKSKTSKFILTRSFSIKEVSVNDDRNNLSPIKNEIPSAFLLNISNTGSNKGARRSQRHVDSAKILKRLQLQDDNEEVKEKEVSKEKGPVKNLKEEFNKESKKSLFDKHTPNKDNKDIINDDNENSFDSQNCHDDDLSSMIRVITIDAFNNESNYKNKTMNEESSYRMVKMLSVKEALSKVKVVTNKVFKENRFNKLIENKQLPMTLRLTFSKTISLFKIIKTKTFKENIYNKLITIRKNKNITNTLCKIKLKNEISFKEFISNKLVTSIITQSIVKSTVKSFNLVKVKNNKTFKEKEFKSISYFIEFNIKVSSFNQIFSLIKTKNMILFKEQLHTETGCGSIFKTNIVQMHKINIIKTLLFKENNINNINKLNDFILIKKLNHSKQTKSLSSIKIKKIKQFKEKISFINFNDKYLINPFNNTKELIKNFNTISLIKKLQFKQKYASKININTDDKTKLSRLFNRISLNKNKSFKTNNSSKISKRLSDISNINRLMHNVTNIKYQIIRNFKEVKTTSITHIRNHKLFQLYKENIVKIKISCIIIFKQNLINQNKIYHGITKLFTSQIKLFSSINYNRLLEFKQISLKKTPLINNKCLTTSKLINLFELIKQKRVIIFKQITISHIIQCKAVLDKSLFKTIIIKQISKMINFKHIVANKITQISFIKDQSHSVLWLYKHKLSKLKMISVDNSKKNKEFFESLPSFSLFSIIDKESREGKEGKVGKEGKDKNEGKEVISTEYLIKELFQYETDYTEFINNTLLQNHNLIESNILSILNYNTDKFNKTNKINNNTNLQIKSLINEIIHKVCNNQYFNIIYIINLTNHFRTLKNYTKFIINTAKS